MIKGIIIIKFVMDTPDVIENEQVVQHEEGIDESDEEDEEFSEEEDDEVEIIPRLAKWDIFNEYYSDKKDKPKRELLESIMKSFIATATLEDLNFRAYPYKFYMVPLKQKNDTTEYCIIYILDINEPLEIVKIHPKKIQDSLFDNISNKTALSNKLRNIFIEKNNILEKVENEAILKNDIGSIANKLIDDGKFQEAQKFIKLAKDIPSKFANAYTKSKKEAKSRHFKSAEKNLRDALNLAKKIDDQSLKDYLELKIETVKKNPAYSKEVKSKYSSIVKRLIKYNKFLSYSSQIPKLHRCMELLDKLEEDEKIDQITELEQLLVEAQQYVRSLRDIDRKIKQIVRVLKD